MLRQVIFTAFISANLSIALPVLNEVQATAPRDRIVLATDERVANGAVPTIADDDECAFCNDTGVIDYASNSHAEWHNTGPGCNPSTGNCASCDPGCQAGAEITDTHAVVAAWYAANRCSAWPCGGGTETPCPEGGCEHAVEAALQLSMESQVEAIVQLIASSKGYVRFNEERGVLQVYGCVDRIVNQFSLPASIEGALASSLRAAGDH